MENTKVSLNAGELSDELAGRIDLAKVQMGCTRAENVRVLRTGGLTRRAGLGFIAATKEQDEPSRLQGFNFSSDTGVVLEFSDLVMRVISGTGLVEDDEDPLEVVTPWMSDQVFALQFAQRVNDIIVTHPDIEPHIIRRVSPAAWTVTPFPWQERVWELDNENTGVLMSVAATTGTTVLTASAALFTSDAWEGTRIRLGHVRAEIPYRREVSYATSTATSLNLAGGSYVVGAKVYTASPPYNRTGGKYAGLAPLGDRSYFTCIANYDSGTDYTAGDDPDDYPTFFRQGVDAVEAVEIEGQWEFESFGTWTGTYVIERSYDAGTTWLPVRVTSSAADKNFLVQDTEDTFNGALFRVILLDMDNADSTDRYAFTVFSKTRYGHGAIVEVLSTTTATFLVEKAFESTAPTAEWYEDAFNPKNGFPKTCTFHQKRLFFGGSDARPQTVWASRSRQIFNFTMGTLAEDGLTFETEATEYESVLWLVSHLSLLVGTTSGIWAITSPDGLSLTPENNAIARQVRLGVSNVVPGAPLQNNVVFLQTKGRKIQELTGGSVEYGGYTNLDLTLLASHITRGGVRQMTTGEIPDSTLYVVSNGQLAVLTYERSQNVVGWTRWITPGVIESVATCQGEDEEDNIYVVVARTVGEETRRFIERIVPDMPRIEEEHRMDELVFLDSSVQISLEEPALVVEGLDHLEGFEVEAFADGAPVGSYTVADGGITLLEPVSEVVVGLPFTSLIETMPLDQGTIGRKSSLSIATVRLRNSLGGQVSQGVGAPWANIQMDQPFVPSGPLPLVSGDAVVNLPSTWQRKPSLAIRQTQPLPFTVLAIRIQGQTSN